MNTNWTPLRKRYLRRCWGQGMTAGQIAEVLGITRNAVIGQARRFGLPGSEKPPPQVHHNDNKPKAKPAPVKPEAPAMPATPVPRATAKTAAIIEAQRARGVDNRTIARMLGLSLQEAQRQGLIKTVASDPFNTDPRRKKDASHKGRGRAKNSHLRAGPQAGKS